MCARAHCAEFECLPLNEQQGIALLPTWYGPPDFFLQCQITRVQMKTNGTVTVRKTLKCCYDMTMVYFKDLDHIRSISLSTDHGRRNTRAANSVSQQ